MALPPFMAFQKTRQFFRHYYQAIVLLAVMLLSSVFVFLGTQRKAQQQQHAVAKSQPAKSSAFATGHAAEIFRADGALRRVLEASELIPTWC